jgi:hypothetical protein
LPGVGSMPEVAKTTGLPGVGNILRVAKTGIPRVAKTTYLPGVGNLRSVAKTTRLSGVGSLPNVTKTTRLGDLVTGGFGTQVAKTTGRVICLLLVLDPRWLSPQGRPVSSLWI